MTTWQVILIAFGSCGAGFVLGVWFGFIRPRKVDALEDYRRGYEAGRVDERFVATAVMRAALEKSVPTEVKK